MILVSAKGLIAANSTVVEKLNQLERISAIPSTEGWKKLRVTRNAIAHASALTEVGARILVYLSESG